MISGMEEPHHGADGMNIQWDPVIFGKIHPGTRSDMTGHDKKGCVPLRNNVGTSWSEPHSITCAALVLTGTDAFKYVTWQKLWIPLEYQAAHGISFGFHSESIEKKNGWWFFGGQLRCSMKDIPGRPACDKGIWYPQWDILYSGYSLGGNPRVLGNQPILWQPVGKWQLSSWMNYQKVPGATLLTS